MKTMFGLGASAPAVQAKAEMKNDSLINLTLISLIALAATATIAGSVLPRSAFEVNSHEHQTSSSQGHR
jgi:hypothetical protein